MRRAVSRPAMPAGRATRLASMMRRSVKLLVDACGRCGPRVLCAVQGVARSSRHTGSVHAPLSSSRGPGVSRGPRPSARLLSGHTRIAARPPETVQSPSGHVCDSTLSVAVVWRRPAERRACRPRESPLAATPFSEWRRPARRRRSRTATARSAVVARPRRSRCVATGCRPPRSASDTNG